MSMPAAGSWPRAPQAPGNPHHEQEAVSPQVFLGAGCTVLFSSLLLGCGFCWRWRQSPANLPTPAMVQVWKAVARSEPLAVSVQPHYQSLEAWEPPSQSPMAQVSSSPQPPEPPNFLSISKKKQRKPMARVSSLEWPRSLSASRSLPGHSQPRLSFSLGYSPVEEELIVTGIRASELPQGSLPGRGCYVKLYLVPSRTGHQKTALQPPGPTVEFHERFSFQGCTPQVVRAQALQMAVYSRDFPGLRNNFVAEVFFPCAQVASDSLSGCLVSYTRELSTIKSKMQKSHSSQDLLVPGLRTPWMGSHGQLFLLLQYQATAHRIKVLVRKAENLHSLGQLPGHREHSVVIGLYQDGQLLDSRETQAIVGRSPVWNAPFLFSLPAGDLHEQSLFFQFTVMQRHLLTRTVTLGWVQIGPEAPAAGRAHWWDMYQHSLQESAQWHPLCPGKPDPPRAAASGSGTRNS
ncbi:synaptotagmin-5-like [Phascolarctos cinereus]|uniref:Synaptotagmin-7-like isoform X1 n=1 Tax=Phascolarctos cinereus TaxID=38626 RepID=A0A6P5L435_PHACI|nr:synaptotagmin-7-like isoform X1 [Phascolarctos cinereus]